MGLEVATWPASLRSVTACLPHSLSGLQGLWPMACFIGWGPDRWLTEGHLIELTAVVLPGLLD